MSEKGSDGPSGKKNRERKKGKEKNEYKGGKFLRSGLKLKYTPQGGKCMVTHVGRNNREKGKVGLVRGTGVEKEDCDRRNDITSDPLEQTVGERGPKKGSNCRKKDGDEKKKGIGEVKTEFQAFIKADKWGSKSGKRWEGVELDSRIEFN